MSLKHYILYISLYGCVLLGVMYAFVSFFSPASLSIVQWDASWYIDIAHSGYFFLADKHSSVAFFPLLPWLIRLLPHNIVYLTSALVALNVISFRCLSLTGEKNSKDLLLFLSSPLILYFFVPYTESLFLFGAVLILLALEKRHISLLIAGTFIAILSRYAAIILVPALLLTGLYEIWNAKEKTKSSLLLYGSGILSLIIGLAVVSYIQYRATGTWNGYQQTHIHWGHYLRWPTIPFYSAMGSSMLLLDQVALLISIISAITILVSFWYMYKGQPFISFSNIQFLSLCYLAGSGASMILFQGGSLDSLGRYIFATAFIYPLFSVLRNLTFKPLHLIYIFIGSSLFFLFTGSLSSVLHFIANEVIAFSLMVFYLLIHRNNNEVRPWNYLLIWATGLGIQCLLFFLYLRGDWVE